MKKKKMSKFLAVAATTTMAVSSLGTAGNVLAASTDEGAQENQAPQQAKVSKFNLFTQPDMLENYNEKFGVDRTKVEAVANGGESQMAWDNVELENIFDGKLNTYWKSGTPNNTRFKNDVTFKFDEVKTLDRIVYSPQQDGKGSGYLLEFEILGKGSEGEGFVKVAEGSHTPKNFNEAIEIKFEPTEFKELRLVFKNLQSHWATASEIMFFKQDTVSEKVSSIFKGEDYVAVNEAYNLEALKALEEEIVGHPLQENFQKTINDAKSILTVKDIEQVEAETKKFIHFDHTDYKNKFIVPRDEIESFKNNGGHYSVAELKNAFDGNTKTYWETNKANSNNFNNEVEVAFTKLTEINRIVYGARESDRKGFITNFEIWVSPTSQGDNFELVSTGRHNKVAGLVEAKFNPVEAKRVKLVAKQSDQNWASLSELAFFKQDKDLDRVESMFVDGTQSELTAGYSTVEEIEALETEVKGHMLYESSMKANFELAKKLAAKEIDVEGTVFTAEQVGDRRAYAKNVLRTDIGSNLQPTGLAALANEQIVVYVEPNGSLQMPSLVFTQTEGSWSSWNRTVQLSPGKNVITVPTVHQDGKYHYNVTPGGPIYIVNPYTKDQQGGEAPTIRIEGADRIPFMTPEKSSEQFKKELADYKAKVDADVKANPDVANRKVLDVVEMASEHVIYTGRASNAYAAYFKENAADPADTLKGYDIWMDQIFKFHGLDGRVGHDPSVIRENIRVMQPVGFMYAYTDHTGIQPPQEGLMYGDFSKNYPGWGLNHEIGHRIDLTAREFSEVTNNMTSMGMSIVAGNMDNRIPYEGIIYKHVINETGYDWNKQGNLAAKLGLYWQLELAHKGYWAELESIYREEKLNVGAVDFKQQHLIKYSSDVLQLDLVEYFARHGIFANDETKDYTSKYPKPTKKIWYLNNSTYHYEGNGFSQNVDVEIDVLANTEAKTTKLSFSINNENKDDLLGYEIIHNDKVIGFTSTGSFVVSNVDNSQANEYQIVAYDKKLNASVPFTVSSLKPTISAEENLLLKLNQQDFNPLDYVKAVDSKGNDITNQVVVESSDVNLRQKGQYQITYKVTADDITATKTIDVTVTSDYTYLSDIKETSSKVGWDVLTKNRALEGGKITLLRNGFPVEYDKGLAAHANSEVVYDIKDKGYDSFEAYIGIDQSMKGSPANARFEVWVDGVKKYHSGNFTAGTNSAFVKIDVKDAETVTLITNSNGGNESDHTVWADAKFTKDSSNPVISITSEATKVGEPIDILGKYTATDAEDGDLTALVNVTGTEAVDFDQASDYNLTYTVTDSDGNEVTATRTISVVDMEDFNYLSTYNWQSENHSYAAPKKDLATSGYNLRLTGDDGSEVVYDKGLGAHSNSTIVYDLTDKEAAYFTSYVGIDRQMYNSVGSVVFQVYVDGEKKFDSGLMTAKMAQQYVEVNLAGAKELKLVVTDGGNGNGSDHATWGDAKLHYANEQRPKVLITEEAIQLRSVSTADSVTIDVKSEEDVAKENIAQIVKVIKDALSDNEVDISAIKAIVAGNPANTTFSGIEDELSVKAIIEEQFADIPGTFEIVLHNHEANQTVEELIESGLTITYRINDNEYTYQSGRMTKN